MILLMRVPVPLPGAGRSGLLVSALNLVMGTIAWPLWNSLEPYQQMRVSSRSSTRRWTRAARLPGAQSKVAIGSGGIFGQGFLEGPQKRLKFLPEQHTDFIYAVIGEETGLIGAGAVLLAYFLILWRLVRWRSD
jgi:rod shape determining protein RodA